MGRQPTPGTQHSHTAALRDRGLLPRTWLRGPPRCRSRGSSEHCEGSKRVTTPVVLVGAGGMGRTWLSTILTHPEAELAAVVDLNQETARQALAEANAPEVPVGSDAVELAQRTGARAIVNVTVPRAHHPVTTAALFAGIPVLGEKPVAHTVAS